MYRGPIQVQFEFDSVDNLANNFEGWYVDDVSVRVLPRELTPAQANRAYVGQTAGARLGASLAGVSNALGDAVTAPTDDLAILLEGNDQIWVIGGVTSGNPPQSPDRIISAVGDLAGFRLLPAGNIDGDAHADFLATGAGRTLLVFGGTAAGELLPRAIDLGGVVAMGDLDGDGRSDLGRAASELLELEDGASLYHLVGHVFLGAADAKTWSNDDLAGIGDVASRADLVVDHSALGIPAGRIADINHERVPNGDGQPDTQHFTLPVGESERW